MKTVATQTIDKPAARPIRLRIPFLTTPFAQNLVYYAWLWPVWWLLGVEQLLLPFFLLYETVRLLVRSRWRVRVNMMVVLSLGLAVWWIVPIIWVDRDFLDIFLKETATIWSQFMLMLLAWNTIREEHEWRLVVRALIIMAAYTAAAGFIYIVGLWRGEVLSVVGRILPASTIDASAFFSSIAYRRFGELAVEVGLLRHRLAGFSLSFSSLSMVCLLLIPLIGWRALVARGARRLFYVWVEVGLVLCLIFAESRISYMAVVAGGALFVVLWLGLLRGRNRLFTLAMALLLAGAAVVLAYATSETIMRSIQATFIDLRPGSWLVRFYIYIYTLQMFPEHPIAGWGVPMRIPGIISVYSAGTHSSILGMLFTHGIIGLFFYLAIWAVVWKAVLRGLGERHTGRERALFWMAAAAAFLSFNIRELADAWWWDQSLTFVLWLTWAATLTAGRLAPARSPAAAPPEGYELSPGRARDKGHVADTTSSGQTLAGD